jgi:hypothetical protein
VLIDPQGLFYGDRISACSDEAQLHFPRLMAASNGFGRIELSISKLHSTVYANFKVKPTREQIQRWIREYHVNFLLFIYRAENGSTWGQWSVSKGKLPKYKTAEDNRSPAADHDAFLAYQRSYVELKKSRYASERDYIDISEDFRNVLKKDENFGNVSEISGDLENLSEDFKTFSQGEVVGEVVGECVGKEQKTSRVKAASDPRHTSFKAAIDAYAAFKRVKLPWDGSEAKALSLLLKSLPDLTLADFQACLNHRGRSPGIPHGDRPRLWLPHVLKYQQGPLNEFGKTGEVSNGNHGKTGHSLNAAQQAIELIGRRQAEADRGSSGEAWDSPASEAGCAGLLGSG